MSRNTNDNSNLPPWLRGLPLPPNPGVERAPDPQPADDTDVPGWLGALGSVDSSGTEPGEKGQGELFDWLQPNQASASDRLPMFPAQESTGEGMPSWLVDLQQLSDTQQNTVPDPAPSPASQPASEDLPSWLRDLPPASPPPATTSSQQPSDPDLPDWLRDQPPVDALLSPSPWNAPMPESPAPAPQPPQQNDEEEDIPDWLRSISDEEVRNVMADESQDMPQVEPFQFDGGPAVSLPSELPSWLQRTDGAEEAEVPSWLVERPSPPQPKQDDIDIPAWLQNTSEPAQEVPDWFAGADLPDQPVFDATSPVMPEDRPAQEQDLPVLPPANIGDVEQTDLETGASALPSWLRNEPAPDEPRDTGSVQDALSLSELPSWLRNNEGSAEPVSADPNLPKPDGLSWFVSDTPGEQGPSSSEQETSFFSNNPDQPAQNEQVDKAFDWTPLTEDTFPQQNELPEWLRAAQDEGNLGAQQPPAEGDTHLPEWLRPLGEVAPSTVPADQQPALSVPALPDGDDLPPWLRDDNDEPLPIGKGQGDPSLPQWLQGVTVDESPEAPTKPPQDYPSAASFSFFDDLAPDTPETPAAKDDPPFLSGADLPQWLRSSSQQSAEATADPTTSEERSLSWFASLPTMDDDVPAAPSPAGPQLALPVAPKRSAEHLAALSVLERLVADPFPAAEPLPAEAPARRWTRFGFDQVLYLLLAIGLVVTLLVPAVAAPLRAPLNVPEANTVFSSVNALGPNDVVLIGYEWDARRISELEPLERAVLDQLIRQQVKVILVSTDPQGSLLSYRYMDRLVAAGYRSGAQDYVQLGYKPGGELALRLLAQDFRGPAGLGSDFLGNNAADGGLAGGTTTGNSITALQDVSMIMVLADDPVDVQGWIEQIHSKVTVPMLFLLPAEAAPIIQPYMRLPNVTSLAGLRGALAYQSLATGETTQIAVQSAQQRAVLLVFVGMVLVGAVGVAIRSLLNRRKGAM